MRILCLGGGGLRGVFQVPVIEHLLAEYEYDLIVGVSAGALNAAFAAQRDVGGMRDHWASAHTRRPMVGRVSGSIGLSPRPWRTLYTLEPLMRQLEEHISLSRMKTPFACGVVMAETAEFRVGRSNEMRSDHELHRWIQASTAIAGLFAPVAVPIDGGHVLCVDGGYRHYLAIPPDCEHQITDLDAVFCAPLTAQRYRERRSLQHQIAWGFEVQLQAARALELERLKRLRETRGINVRVFVPCAPVGGVLDGRAEIMAHRMALGERAVGEPLVL